MEWFQRVPKDLHQNLRFRQFLYKKARADAGLQRALREICKRDILFWVNAFVWTFDPRPKRTTIPFLTYEYQDEGIIVIQEAINAQEPIVMPKSRDMGASWLVMLIFDHFSTFTTDCKFFVMSRKGELVDKKNDSDSLFWKIDFIHKMLPYWLRPEIELTTHGVRVKMAINYVATRSTITGATTTKAAGVGGRAKAVCVDEFSRYEPAAASIVKSGLTGDVADCVIWPFTRSPEMGKLHPCQELVDQGKRGDIGYLPMHWSKHPRKNIGLHTIDPGTRQVEIIDKEYDFTNYKFQLDGRFLYHSVWFDRYRKRKGNDREVSANLEFDDDINDNLVYDPIMIKEYAAAHVRAPNIVGDIIYDELTGDVKEFVVKPGGPIKLWMPLDAYSKPPQVLYGAGVDVSLGVGTTNSVFSAGRCDTGEKILEFATALMKPDQFAVKCVALLNWLNSGQHRAMICWERQGPGETFGDKVIELGYHPVWKRQRTPFVGYVTEKAGWSALQNRHLHTSYESALRNRTFINHSKEALEECLQYENTPTGPKHKADRNRKNDPSGATINHGDRCVADAQCEMILREHGASASEPKEAVSPGSLAWILKEEEIRQNRSKELYPHWRDRIRA